MDTSETRWGKKQSKSLTEAQAKRQAGYDQNRYIQAEHNNEKKASEMAVSDSSAVCRIYRTYRAAVSVTRAEISICPKKED